MTWVVTALGALLVVAAMWDVFHTLWHPKGFGGLARVVFRTVWRAFKPLNRGDRSSEAAGPVGLLLVVLGWAGLVVTGFALVYWPQMPDGFHYGSSLDPSRTSGPLDAVYLSVVVLSTLGLGDVMPADSALRVVLPLEGLCGFVLLTAGISWVLQLYPALGRRRSLALRLSALADSDVVPVVRAGETSVAVTLLDTLTSSVSGVAVDLEQYGESYFFREQKDSRSLASQAPLLLDLVAAGEAHRAAEVRTAAGALGAVVGRLAATLDEEFLSTGEDPAGVLRAFREDHQR